MKSKVLNLALIITSLLGYLEWGNENRMFLFQLEKEIISKVFNDATSVIHPLIILPIFEQVLLMLTLFQKTPNKILSLFGLGCLSLLLLLMFVMGVIRLEFKILLSTIPFLFTGVIAVNYYGLKHKASKSTR